jgi:histidyl-tRNA synthetase
VTLELVAQGIPKRSAETILYRMMNRTFLAQTGRLELHQFSTNRPEANDEMLDYQYASFAGLRSDREMETAASDSITELKTIVRLTKETSASQHLEIDPSLARGLSYYTGTIMEINVADLPGSLGGGGRYDNLVGMFLGKDIPACGFSLGLERIIVVMEEGRMFDEATKRGELTLGSADVMVTIWNEDSVGDSLALATEWRNKQVRVDLYPETDKLAKQFKYASARGIPYVAVIGDDERARGEVTIKDMNSGRQTTFARERAADEMREMIRRDHVDRSKG